MEDNLYNPDDMAQFEELVKRDRENKQKAQMMQVMGSIANNLTNNQSAGNYWLGQMNKGGDNSSFQRSAQMLGNQDPFKEEMAKSAFMAQAQGMRNERDMMDPNSQLSQDKIAMLSKVSPEIGAKLKGLSASQVKESFPLLWDRFKVEDNRGYQDQARDDAQSFQASQQGRGFDHALAMQDRGFENQAEMEALKKSLEGQKDDQDLVVPGLGKALTITDAKDLKAGVEMKEKLDRQLTELIGLREKYGSEFFNRDAVARGRQLSKDILLAYKNLAKLGVLSKADEDIINAIMPPDPLAFDMGQLAGQDPIMNKLKKFREDIGTDFETSVTMRLAGGGARASQLKQDRLARSLEDASKKERGDGGLINKAQADGSAPNIVEMKGKLYRLSSDGFYEEI